MKIAESLQWKKDFKIKFYHRTKEDMWIKIQEEGVLWGKKRSSSTIDGKVVQHEGRRYTYLSPDDWGENFGTVLLEVEYKPIGVGVKDDDGKPYDNYCMNPPSGNYCWQFSVFKPIDLKYVKRIL